MSASFQTLLALSYLRLGNTTRPTLKYLEGREHCTVARSGGLNNLGILFHCMPGKETLQL